MANVKIVNRIIVESKYGKNVFFTLSDGSTVSEREAVLGVLKHKIYGAKVITMNGKQIIRGDSAIPTLKQKEKSFLESNNKEKNILIQKNKKNNSFYFHSFHLSKNQGRLPKPPDLILCYAGSSLSISHISR